jgi:hypothetical protein
MPFTSDEFHDLIRLVEAHPEWRSELRRLVLTDELLALPEQVGALTREVTTLATTQQRLAEQMTALTIQVTALYSMEEYQRIRDGSYKWVNVPYWQSYNQIDRAILSPGDEKLANPLVALFLMLTPPLNRVRLQAILLDRHGFVSEATTANVVIYRAEEGLVSPLPEKILPGISLAVMTELLEPLRIPVAVS